MNNHSNTVKDVAIHNGYAAFWGSIFSNFYPVKINIDGKEFNCTEQYFMYMKAVTFNDMETADEILNETDPKIIRKLGRKVKNYDDETWSDIRYDIMKTACYAKFTQDEKCKDALLNDSLKDCKFVEGNPYDKVWSVGLEWINPAIGNPENWQGENLLGKILDEIRDEIIHETMPSIIWTRYFDFLSAYISQMKKEYVKRMQEKKPFTLSELNTIKKELNEKLEFLMS